MMCGGVKHSIDVFFPFIVFHLHHSAHAHILHHLFVFLNRQEVEIECERPERNLFEILIWMGFEHLRLFGVAEVVRFAVVCHLCHGGCLHHHAVNRTAHLVYALGMLIVLMCFGMFRAPARASPPELRKW